MASKNEVWKEQTTAHFCESLRNTTSMWLKTHIEWVRQDVELIQLRWTFDKIYKGTEWLRRANRKRERKVKNRIASVIRWQLQLYPHSKWDRNQNIILSIGCAEQGTFKWHYGQYIFWGVAWCVSKNIYVTS